jgi:broad specificity phosphatase PhoE
MAWTFLLIRHGMTAFNHDDPVRDRIRGWGNMELSELGQKEAVRLADIVRKHAPVGMLFTSDLPRARQTAHVIAARNNLPMRVMMDFRPWNTGDFVGKSASEVVPILTRYAQQKPSEPVPGGESFDTFRFRFFSGLLKILREDEYVGIVTHHRNERLLKAWIKAGSPLDGSIDEDEFCRKGSPTGHHEVITFSESRLAKVVEMRSGSWEEK